MRDGLACVSMDVDANVEAIGLILFDEQLFDVVDHEPAGGLLFKSDFSWAEWSTLPLLPTCDFESPAEYQ